MDSEKNLRKWLFLQHQFTQQVYDNHEIRITFPEKLDVLLSSMGSH